MKKYGLQIGKLGLEFSDKASRDKALLTFTNCSVVGVNTGEGVVYEDNGDGSAFSVYERETKESMHRCGICKGVFSHETCSSRAIPEMDYSGGLRLPDAINGDTQEKCVCDACEAKLKQKLELAKAEKVLADQGVSNE